MGKNKRTMDRPLVGTTGKSKTGKVESAQKAHTGPTWLSRTTRPFLCPPRHDKTTYMILTARHPVIAGSLQRQPSYSIIR